MIPNRMTANLRRSRIRIVQALNRVALIAAIWALSASGGLYAQSCALCYQSAAASGSHFIQALKNGIFILILAPLIVCTAVAVLAYRKRNISSRD